MLCVGGEDFRKMRLDHAVTEYAAGLIETTIFGKFVVAMDPIFGGDDFLKAFRGAKDFSVGGAEEGGERRPATRWPDSWPGETSWSTGLPSQRTSASGAESPVVSVLSLLVWPRKSLSEERPRVSWRR